VSGRLPSAHALEGSFPRGSTRLRAWARIAGYAAVVEHSLGTAILRPAGNVVTDRNRALLAVGDGANPGRADPVAREIVANRLGAACAERDVVLTRAALVGVSLDGDRILRIPLQPP